MTVELAALCVDAGNPAALGRFWGELLSRRPVDDPMGIALPPIERPGFTMRFLPTDAPKTGPHRAHLHLTSRSDEDQPRTVRRVLELGGRHLDVGQLPEERHIVLADPEGNEFCVIEAGNRYLAGTPFLGEVACDGSRTVGLFWAAALRWPLVWDEGEETAIQHPGGGAKISWGGEDAPPEPRHDRLHFDVTGDDSDADRLVALGAAHSTHNPCIGADAMADPDGNPFCLFRR